MKTLKILFWGITALAFDNFAYAQTWTQTSAPITNWVAIASSVDGAKLVAAAGHYTDSPIYTSTNAGANWTPTSVPGEYWASLASSATGVKLVAVSVNDSMFDGPSTLWTSDDSGITWVQKANATYQGSLGAWKSVASSADGTKLVVAGFARISSSSDSGDTWSPTDFPDDAFTSIASAADGTKLVAVSANISGYDDFGAIYTSIDSGNTWVKQTNAPNQNWLSVASSSDGAKLAAVSDSNGGGVGSGYSALYTSIDSGTNWIEQTNAVLLEFSQAGVWQSVASSADGTKLAATGRFFDLNTFIFTSPVYTSTNSGATWISNSVPNGEYSNNYVTGIQLAYSADGVQCLVGSGDGNIGGIYILRSSPTPLLNLNSSKDDSIMLSWIVPSSSFELQQSSDLATTNWMVVTNAPVLNLTNLQNQIILSPTGSSGFYRLKTP